jgi:AcrR family transcriptional regulator
MGANNKKKDLILAAYQLIEEKGIDKITIRDIAARASCTSAVIYRHFENLDDLLMYASVRFLEAYVQEFQSIMKTNADALDMERLTWKTFSKYAFRNVEVFDRLFWGKYKDQLGDAIYEYYQIFPDNWKNLDGLYTTVFFNNDLKERNRTVLHWAVRGGYFHYDDADFLVDIQCDLFYGIMMGIRKTYRNPGIAEQAEQLFMKDLIKLEDQFRIDI